MNMYRQHQHFGRGYRYCPACGHLVNPLYGGCRTCMTPLANLVMFDDVLMGNTEYGIGFNDPIGFDPVDDSIAFNIPGTDLAIEPDGLDVNLGFGTDVPLDDVDPFAW